MHKRIRTTLSLLVCVMMLLTQFAFALDDGNAEAGAEAADNAAAASEIENEEAAAEEETPEEPAVEEAAPEEKTEETTEEEAAPEEEAPEEPAEEEPEPAETGEEEIMPAFRGEAELDGVKVSVKAAEGVFPEGAELSVEKVSDDAQKKVDKAVDAARDNDLNVAAAYTFDVKVLDKDGEEVQPADNKKAEVSFKLDEADDANLDAAIYHLEETKKGLRAEELRSDTAKDTVSAETDGFSYYTVEFTYGGLQYVMDGGSSVALSDILGKVGLEGEASDVSVSNDKLFSAEKKAGKWMVTAHRAFTSEEWMKVIIDGIEYKIVVTDAQTLPDIIDREMELAAGSEYDGGATGSSEITVGAVMGPSSGTAAIKNYSISNNAKNSRTGGANDNGSAFVSRGNNNLTFDNVGIDSQGMNSLVFNIWGNSSVSAKSVTINGRDFDGKPFLLVGGYPNGAAGTLNFSGTSAINSAINNMTNTYICGGNNNSVINVTDGTLTINDSDFALGNKPPERADSGVSFVVKDGAVLVLDNTDIDVTYNSAVTAITVEEGGKLILQNGSSIKATGAKEFNKGIIVSSGSVVIKDSEISGITKNGGDSSIIEIKKGNLTITDSTIGNNTVPNSKGGVILANNADTVTIGGTTAFNNNKSGNAPIYVGQSTALIISGESVFSGNSSTGNGNTYGGAVWAYKTPVTINDGVTFEKNTAKFGGAVYLQECTDTTIGKVTFKGNGTIFTSGDWPAIQTMDGGALYIREGSAVMNGTVFQKNIAATSTNSSGGAAYIYGALVDINGAKFTENTALRHGGALTVAHGSRVNIGDLNGDPAEFIDNLVEYGVDFAGGGLFINVAYVKMMDAAIYGNAAEDAGGGLSTCTTGTAEIRVLDGAAIFDNEILMGNHEHGRGYIPPAEDVEGYKDVFFQTTDHKDADTGEIIPGRDGFPTYAYELYERMFNGGIHNWKVKPFTGTNDDGKRVDSMVAQSNPSNKDASGAKVIFKGNQAWRHPYETVANTTVSGGAIGCNGLLEIGTSTEIKIVKLWNDKKNAAGVRPSEKDFLESLKIFANGEEIDKEGLQISVITKDVDKFVLYNNVVNADGKPVDFGNNEPWLIIVSGLPKYVDDTGELEIKYTVGEGELSHYRLVKEEGDMNTYFKLENKAQLVDIPVEKVWDEEDGYTGLRPEEITVDLLADGRKVKELKLNESNKWKGTFRDLVRYNGDKEIRYTVEEAEDENLSYYTCKVSGNAASGFTITNKLEVHKASETGGTKTWKGDDDVLDKRPSEIKVKLLADGKVFKKVTVSEADDWKIEFGDIPEYKDGKKIKYTIEEVKVEGYDASYDGFDITNTYTGAKPDEADTNGSKSGSKGAYTGDYSPVAALVVLIAACTAGIAGIAVRRRKKNEE